MSELDYFLQGCLAPQNEASIGNVADALLLGVAALLNNGRMDQERHDITVENINHWRQVIEMGQVPTAWQLGGNAS